MKSSKAAEQDAGCSINVMEQVAMRKAREEVYIGFWELGAGTADDLPPSLPRKAELKIGLE